VLRVQARLRRRTSQQGRAVRGPLYPGAQLLPHNVYQTPPPTIFIEDGATVVRVRSLVLRAAESHDGAECGLSCAVTTGRK
jgi:hypothetical protein